MQSETLRAAGAAIVAEVHAAAGERLAAGALILVTELMKMRHELRAERAAEVEAVLVEPGDALAGGEPLVRLRWLEAAAPAPAAAAEAPRADLEAFRARMALLEDEARPEAVAKRHAQRMRTARENVADLFDPGSFQEYGALAVAAMRRTRPLEDLRARTPADGIVVGTGAVGGLPAAAMAVDYTVLAGTQGFHHHRKMDRLIAAAGPGRLPIVLFAEGGGGRPNDGDVTEIMAAWLNVSSFRHFAAHPGPKIGIAAGYCFAGNAALFGVCDIRIAAERSFIGMGGPAMIEGGGLGRVAAEAIGPSDLQSRTGVIDLLVADEAEAVAAAKRLLGLAAPAAPGEGDPAALRAVVPPDRTRAYDMRKAAAALLDGGDFLELRRGFGAGMIAGFGRIGGRAVGLLANNPLHLGGAIDGEAAAKAARHLQLCDRWGIPVVTLCDTPGFMVGPEAEAAGQVGHVSRLVLAGAHFSQPLVTVILRKAYGLGAMAMAGGGFDRPQLCCAWPTGEVGAMGLEGAVRLGARDRLAAIADDAAREAEVKRLVAELMERGSALEAASLLEFDAVIDPADTRPAILRALDAAGPARPGPRWADAF